MPAMKSKDKLKRCSWSLSTPAYIAYHDTEWGFPVRDDRRLFEKICLEGFQSGLSWLTILNKRENFRAAFANFEMREVAKLGKRDVTRLLKDAGIIRHRGKIESTINNAARAIEIVEEFGSLSDFVWSYEPPRSERPKRITKKTIPALTPTSTRLSKDLKKRGWTYVGPTTIYAFMQAMGLVNDHVATCAFRKS